MMAPAARDGPHAAQLRRCHHKGRTAWEHTTCLRDTRFSSRTKRDIRTRSVVAPGEDSVMASRELERIRNAILDGRYALTEHAYDEMA